jgi:hypothetical protein
MTDISNIWRFDLGVGRANAPDQACLLSATSYLVDGSLCDHPAFVSPIVAGIGRIVNDTLPFDKRQKLKAYIPRLIGTADPLSETDRWSFVQCFVRSRLVPLGARAWGHRVAVDVPLHSIAYDLTVIAGAPRLANLWTLPVLRRAYRGLVMTRRPLGAIVYAVDRLIGDRPKDEFHEALFDMLDCALAIGKVGTGYELTNAEHRPKVAVD